MLDHETNPAYEVTVTARDPEGLSSSVDVTIMVTDVDEAPEITVGGLAISGMTRVDYDEDRRDAVATYVASGPESANARWSLEGDDAADFRISAGGELTFVRAPDYENPADADTDNTYMVTIMADDGTYMNTRDVAVRVVRDVDEVEAGDPLLARYDDDKDGWIQLKEARDAVGDYFGPPKGVKLSLDDTRKVVGLYFEYKNSQ